MTSLLSRRALLAASFVLLLFACGFQNRAELECEEAVSHLVECCPGFRSSELECVSDRGCGSSTAPALDLSEATCVRSKSCDELRARRYCERAQWARSMTTFTDDPRPSPPRGTVPGQASVCP